MILRSATRVDFVYRTSAAATQWQETGFYQQRSMSRVETKDLEITWSSVPHAVVVAVRQHWLQFGARGIAFEYRPPGYGADEWFTYEEPLTVRSRTAQSYDMRTTVRQAIARD